MNDIAKLIEEVNIIETEFNETNRFYALVQSRIMANMGHTPETLAQQPEKKVVLENKFIYEKEVIQESIPQYEEVFTKKIEKPQVETTGNFGLLEIIMVLNIIIVVVAFGLFQLSGVMETNKAKTTVSQLNTITEFARHFYTAPLHGPISTKSFVESGLIPNAGLKDNAFVGEFGTIQVVEAENQTYKIVLDNVPSKSCHYIPLKFENTTSVVVDDTAIHNNKVDTQRLTDACAGDSHKMEFYVPKEKYLK